MSNFRCACPFAVIGPDPRPDRSGKRFKRCLGHCDAARALLRLLEIEDQLKNGAPPPSRSYSIAQAIDLFLASKKTVCKDRRRKFERVLRSMEAFLAAQGRTMLTHVKESDLDAFIGSWTGAISTQLRSRQMMKEFWL